MADDPMTGETDGHGSSPTRDDEIAQALVDAPPELNAAIRLAEYDLEWPRQYERLASTVRAALPDPAAGAGRLDIRTGARRKAADRHGARR